MSVFSLLITKLWHCEQSHYPVMMILWNRRHVSHNENINNNGRQDHHLCLSAQIVVWQTSCKLYKRSWRHVWSIWQSINQLVAQIQRTTPTDFLKCVQKWPWYSCTSMKMGVQLKPSHQCSVNPFHRQCEEFHSKRFAFSCHVVCYASSVLTNALFSDVTIINYVPIAPAPKVSSLNWSISSSSSISPSSSSSKVQSSSRDCRENAGKGDKGKNRIRGRWKELEKRENGKPVTMREKKKGRIFTLVLDLSISLKPQQPSQFQRNCGYNLFKSCLYMVKTWNILWQPNEGNKRVWTFDATSRDATCLWSWPSDNHEHSN